ncbi:DNA polymerase III subunit delta [Pseudoalteromonas spongiae]|uniref:DNA polymerase III subunit delta n=1 Tax=Pseudoalteromonas spongiae TaxID=298657 RepID=UPI00110BECC6|nr:DNA polymerase III subunit delta [Pseudoalteromonas spongiae]TMO81755.1 DNA polymerase III subunit delta [Pseudoalteromonas spongiae]
MRIYPNQLVAQLKQGLAPFYLLFGEEAFLLNQAANQVKSIAKAQGFDEVIRFAASPQFDWQEIVQEYASLSLFANRKIIELELGDSKPNAAASKLLQTLAQNPNPDCILVIKGEKVGNDIQRGAWFKALDKHGLFVPCYPLQGKQLFAWLEQQCQSLNLRLSADAKTLLVDYNQDNLFAISQELEKLSLLNVSGEINAQTLAPTLVNQSRLDVFDLSDALLTGNSVQISKVMLKLKQENVEPTIILWALVREFESLQAMQQAIANGESFNAIFSQFKVWKNKQAITEQALRRLTLVELNALGDVLAEFDLAYKQHQHIDAYQHLLHIALMFVGPLPFSVPFNAKVEQYANL